MTTQSSEAFITQMKLRELRAQRDQLRLAYASLSMHGDDPSAQATALPELYEGLRALTFAGQPFHPDVANLDLLLHDLAAGRAAAQTVAFWHAYLQRERSRGQLRADTVFLFGSVLEEWAARRTQLPASANREQVTAALRARVLQSAPPAPWPELLTTLVHALGVQGTDRSVRMAELVDAHVGARVEPEEVRVVLEQLRAEPSRTAALRAEAARVVDSDLLLHEFADALTILIDQRTAWEWPADGVAAQARWSRTKWRLFLDDDLPTACLLEVLGARWWAVFQQALGDATLGRQDRLRRLQELNAPEILVAHERELLAAIGGAKAQLPHDIWAESGESRGRSDGPGWQHGSVLAQRERALQRLRDAWERDGYGSEPYGGVMATAVMLINAELALGRAAFPDRPLYVVKLDMEDYYPSLPHPLLLAMLAHLGVPERELAFFRAYLAVPLRGSAPPQPAQQGLPNKRRLSDLLGELVLRLLDLHIQRAARVLVVRVMDDVCLIAASAEEAVGAWEAASAFAAACGLKLNRAKCGAVGLGGPAPEGLPQGPVTWQMLALGDDGQWRVHQPALEAFLEHARWRVAQAAAVLSKVELYNQQLTTLVGQLALTAPLGAAHRASVDAALARYRAWVLGADQPAEEALRELLQERFLEPGSALDVPEAWLAWPITAGGLGLAQPTVLAQPFAAALLRRKPVAPPDMRPPDWQRTVNGWSALYSAHLGEVEPLTPAEQPVMEALVNDFIARGQALSDGAQQGLSCYWRWVLYMDGPQIVERLGTFRFLETALVPQQLIVQRHLGDTEASVLLSDAPTD